MRKASADGYLIERFLKHYFFQRFFQYLFCLVYHRGTLRLLRKLSVTTIYSITFSKTDSKYYTILKNPLVMYFNYGKTKEILL